MRPRDMMLYKMIDFLLSCHENQSKRITQKVHGRHLVPHENIGAVILFLTLLGIFLLTPSEAQAVQIHGPPEGLYTHQMAHLFFGAAMVFLLSYLRKHPLGHGPAWRYLKLSLLFFLLWNINAIIVHSLDIHLPEEAIIRTPNFWQQRLSPPFNLEKWAYFITKHDHVWCVPAMFFLVLSLRTFCKDIEIRLKKGKGVPR